MKTLVMGLLWSGCLYTPPDLTVENLSPKLTVLGSGAFERWSGGALNWINTHNRDPRRPLASCIM